MSIPDDTSTAASETPMRDHVERFWRLLETEHVRILLDLRRVIGEDAPDGPIIYWDGSSFSDDVAKALVADRAVNRASAVPSGWRLVPEQLDHKMQRAFSELHVRQPQYAQNLWNEILAAAPPSSPASDAVDFYKLRDEMLADTEKHGCSRCWSDDLQSPCTCEAERTTIRCTIYNIFNRLIPGATQTSG